MKKTAAADIVIFGGGVAGLWLLNRLRAAGFSAILFESQGLGAGQTHKAQGIIHGGMKYALSGVLTKDASSLNKAPALWRACLSGEDELDLSQVPILSKAHYLFTTSRLAGKLAGFLASSALSTDVERLKKSAYPAVFQHPQFKGEVFALDEWVIDVHGLIRELVKTNQDAIFHVEPFSEEGLIFSEKGDLEAVNLYRAGKHIEVRAQRFIFTAGAGNEIVLNKLSSTTLKMQRRPLHMVLVQPEFDMPLYAHGVGMDARPRITITTHYTKAQQMVWYLGGLLSETGINKNSSQQIDAAKSECEDLFPWLNFKNAKWSSFYIDRAEPQQKNGLKPSSFYYKNIQNIYIAWPTKLALAPQLADEIISDLKKHDLSHQVVDLRELRTWPMPLLAKPMWEDVF